MGALQWTKVIKGVNSYTKVIYSYKKPKFSKIVMSQLKVAMLYDVKIVNDKRNQRFSIP